MERIIIFILCLFLLSCDQKINAPTENNANSYSSSILTTDSIRKLKATEKYLKYSKIKK